MERRFAEAWQRLQGKKPHMPHFLEEVSLDGIRGFQQVRVRFDYPVSVVAGGNATGKSTVLFAAACAYKVPGAGVRDFVPSTLFPDYRPKSGSRRDEKKAVVLEYNYSTPGGRQAMLWRRQAGWTRSFLGRKGASQPTRPVYLRTLSNLSNPSEVRGVLSMSRHASEPSSHPLTASQVTFAQRILPFRYSEVVDLSSGNKNLLFAAQEAGAAYSELHMAAGERAILRLSKEIAQLNGALVLIDEVEAGLHPWVQQLLMLHLQDLALRNDCQIIVTSHSPVVLESVPVHGRIFLERDDAGRVSSALPFRDLVQDALYGRAREKLLVLCEDEAAESILQGVLDHLVPQEGFKRNSIEIGRDTGAEQFPAHASAMRKFGMAEQCVFVLDGDKSDSGLADKIRRESGSVDTSVLFMPGRCAPEVWIWDLLTADGPAVPQLAGMAAAEIASHTSRISALYDSAADSASQIGKFKLAALAEEVGMAVSEICRSVARHQAGSEASDIQPLVESLKSAMIKWRNP